MARPAFSDIRVVLAKLVRVMVLHSAKLTVRPEVEPRTRLKGIVSKQGSSQLYCYCNKYQLNQIYWKLVLNRVIPIVNAEDDVYFRSEKHPVDILRVE